ncbi:MAG: aspartate kinase [Verrucomicrobiota bacterium]|nr:aspartate kinase [Verrucomicrobiota bacterium]
MKFGGASVVTPQSFHRVAKIVQKRKEAGEPVVVVVSAMANATDELLELAQEVHPNPPRREQDMLVSVGERISISLLAMALDRLGVEAVSFTGSQSGIITNEDHSEAKIIDVRPHRLSATLKAGAVAIVAGFQGVSRAGEITTLGRGGSDTSAVALAAALDAPCVDFYKDVEGIYDRDPKQGTAQLLPQLEYTQAKEIAKGGAKVLHLRSIELAEKNGIQLAVRSFHRPETIGTLVGPRRTSFSGRVYE